MRPDARGEHQLAFWLLLPAVIVVAVFEYVPMYGLSIAFREFSWRAPFGGPPVGMDNIRRLFRDPGLRAALSNTIQYWLAGTAGVAVTGIAVAVMFHLRSTLLRRPVFSTVILLPSYVSWVIVSVLLSRLFEVRGPINEFLIRSGMLDRGIAYLTNTTVFPFIFVGSTVWKHLGLMAFVCWMVLQQTEADVRDAAAIDGLGPVGTVFRVELASVRVQLWALVLLVALILFDSLGEQALSIASAAIRNQADVVDSYVYRIGIQRGRWALGAAGSFVSSIIRLPIVLTLLLYLATRNRGELS